jgi:hypothetical protein
MNTKRTANNRKPVIYLSTVVLLDLIDSGCGAWRSWLLVAK